jgi:uncharacterized protein
VWRPFTGSVREAQENYYGKARRIAGALAHDELTDDEASFIQSRDSYMGTINESGWPYIQHRGGKPGFLRVIGPSTLAFADYKGNRQLLSTGNLAANPRVALFLMDYPQRTRLKILGHARVENARDITPRYTAGEIQELVSSRNLVAMYVQATVARLPRLSSQTNSVYQP